MSVIQGTVADDTGDIVLAMLQTMHSRDYACPNQCGLLIVDECHHVPAATFRKVVMRCNTKYRLGLSATPDRSDGIKPQIMLGPLTGPTATVPTMDSPGFFTGFDFDGSRIHVSPYRYRSPTYNSRPPMQGHGDSVNHAAMLNVVSFDDTRTDLIAALIASMEDHRHILCLVHRKMHRARIQDALTIRGVESEILSPTCPGCPSARVVISTYVYAGEGFDEKRFDTLILASPASDVRQAVGRVLRKMNDPSHAPLVVDIVDEWGPFLRQYQKRKATYSSMGCTMQTYRDLTMYNQISRFLPEQ